LTVASEMTTDASSMLDFIVNHPVRLKPL